MKRQKVFHEGSLLGDAYQLLVPLMRKVHEQNPEHNSRTFTFLAFFLDCLGCCRPEQNVGLANVFMRKRRQFLIKTFQLTRHFELLEQMVAYLVGTANQSKNTK